MNTQQTNQLQDELNELNEPQENKVTNDRQDVIVQVSGFTLFAETM